jgi:hypothetical protein
MKEVDSCYLTSTKNLLMGEEIHHLQKDQVHLLKENEVHQLQGQAQYLYEGEHRAMQA